MGFKMGYISNYKLQSNVDFYVSPEFRRGEYSHFFEIPQLKLWPGCCRTTTWPVYHRLQREFKKSHTHCFFLKYTYDHRYISMSMSMISHQNAGSVPQKPKKFCRAASSSPPRVPKSRSFTGDFLDIMIHDLLAGE